MVGYRMLATFALLILGCFYSNTASAQCGPNGCPYRPGAKVVAAVASILEPAPAQAYQPQGVVFEQAPRVTQRVVLRSRSVVRRAGSRVLGIFRCN